MSLIQTSLTHTFRNRILQSADRIAFKRKVRGIWEEITYQEYYNFVQEICFSLLESGVERGDRVALLSQSRTEWAFADMGILSCGAITVPIYQSNLASEIEYILKNSEAKAVFVENETQLEKVLSIQNNVPSLKTIVIFEYKNAQALRNAIPLEEFCQKGLKRKDPKVFDDLLQNNGPDDTATIVYTSGTTGLPKGVVLTHSNFISELSDIESTIGLSQEDTILSFLPFAHILARIELYCGLTFGWTHAFAEGIPQLVDNLAEIRPTFMFAVPRIYEKVYNKILSQVQDGSSLKKKIFYWSLSVGREVSQRTQKGLSLSLGLSLKYAVASKLVFSKLKQKFGGRLKFFISGGAPLSRDIAEFFHAAGFLILEGYGLTETTAAAFTNQPYRYEFGTVGPPLGEVQVRIAADGEILIKSKKVFKEYFKNPQATAEVLKEGWLYSGDIGHLTEKGNLKITDRKKDIIVTSGGKNVAPQKIENLLKTQRYISQAMVYGDKKNYLTALITLNLEEALKFAKNNHIEEAQIFSHPKIEKLIADLIAETNKALPSFETIKKFRILKNDFSIETGELTPSLKVKRKYCSEKYKEVIQSMY
ncbi:MAG: long-chain fatty acid--CoA ligase [Deltaproteobacteria bacterium]|nr:long-chain fatty acid--CoA ligase [Deltaproteobacteria bacterium]